MLTFCAALCFPASAFGDPHFITFDGTKLTFKGLGEYTVLESNLTGLQVQGRTRRAQLLDGKEAERSHFGGLHFLLMRRRGS